jgi:hypothetical protein
MSRTNKSGAGPIVARVGCPAGQCNGTKSYSDSTSDRRLRFVIIDED